MRRSSAPATAVGRFRTTPRASGDDEPPAAPSAGSTLWRDPPSSSCGQRGGKCDHLRTRRGAPESPFDAFASGREKRPLRAIHLSDRARVDDDLSAHGIDRSSDLHPLVLGEHPRRDVHRSDRRNHRVGDAAGDDVARKDELVGGGVVVTRDEPDESNGLASPRGERPLALGARLAGGHVDERESSIADVVRRGREPSTGEVPPASRPRTCRAWPVAPRGSGQPARPADRRSRARARGAVRVSGHGRRPPAPPSPP